MPYSEKRIQSVISGPSSASPPKVGMIVLSTDFTCERDYSRLAHAHKLDFDLYVNRIHFENPMTEQSLAAMLEHLRAIRGDLSDHGERLARIELRLSAIEQTLGSLYALSGSDRETMSAVIRRVERIERRLELSDGPV